MKHRDSGDTLHNPWLLTLLICTLLSPVLPGMCLAAIAAAACWKYRWELFEADLVTATLLGLAGVSLIATLIHETPWGFVSILFFLLYLVVYSWMKKRVSVAQLYNGLIVMSAAGTGIVAVMLIHRWGGFEFLPSALAYFFGLESWKPTVSLRSTGTSGNANLAAGLLVCLALIAFHKAVAAGVSLGRRLFWAGAFVAYIVGFHLTGTRMAWIALSLGLAVVLWFTYGERMRVAVRGLHFSNVWVFVIAAVTVLFANPNWLPRGASFNTDLFLRLQIWERSLLLFQDNWLFGVLPLHFGEVFREYFGQYEFHAHNLLIGVAVDYGIIGFALFALLLVSTLIRGFQWIHRAAGRERELAIVLMALFFAFIGQGIADYTILVPQTGWVFFMSLSFIHIRWSQLAAAGERKPLKQNVPPAPHTVHSLPK